MVCRRCGKEFTEDWRRAVKANQQPPQFCSRACANSRVFSEKTRKLKAQKQRGYLETHPKALKDFIEAGANFRNRKGKMFSTAPQKRGAATSAKNRKEETKSRQDDILQNGASWEKVHGMWATLAKRLVKEVGHCEICGQPPSWNDKPLTLHVDHIDGDLDHNSRENLRVICPHCHSQTPYWGARNKGRGRSYKKKIVSNQKKGTHEK